MNSELPIAMSFLTLVGGFIGALRPISQDFILSLGAPIAFTIGSIVLLAATGLLRYFDPGVNDRLSIVERQPIVPLNVGLLLGTGLGIAWGLRCLFETLPKVFKLHIPQIDPVLAMVVISLAISASALPGGWFASKYGNQRLILIGIAATSLGLLMIVLLPSYLTIFIAVLLMMLCLSWVTNGAVPFAIGAFPADRSGLAIGLYFGGFSGGISLFSSLFNPVSNLTPLLGGILGSIGFLFAGFCVLKSAKSIDTI